MRGRDESCYSLFQLLISAFSGKAKGILFEDDNDGYEYQQGQFLLTYYEAELSSSIVSVKISGTEGLWKRPKRKLHLQLLLGDGAMV